METPTSGTRSPLPRGDARVRWIVFGVVGLALLLVLGGGVGVISGLFAAGDHGLSRRVLGLVNTAIGSDSTRFVCERVHGTILRGAVLEHPRLLVRSDRGEATWARARRAVVEYDLWALLVSKRRTFTVRVDSLEVLLARDGSGDLILPRFRKGRGGPGGETTIRATLRAGSVRFDRESLVLGDLDGNATVALGPAGSSVLVERLKGRLSGPNASLPVEAAGMVAFADSLWRVDPLTVAFASSRMTASGEWLPKAGRARDGTLLLAPLALEEVLPLFDVDGVAGTLKGEVQFQGSPQDAATSGCLTGTLAGEPFDTLLVRASFQREGVRIDRMESRLRGATVIGSGWVDYGRGSGRPSKRPGELEANLQFANANPASLPWWKAPAGTPKGTLSGRALLHITPARPRASVRVVGTLSKSAVGRIPIERARFVVNAPPAGGLLLDSLLVDTPGARLTGAGTLGADGALRATTVTVVNDLSRMEALLAPLAPRGGSGRVTAQLGGTLEAPTLDVRAALSGTGFQSGLGAESLHVAAAGTLAPGLDLRGALRVARLRAKDRPLGNVVASFSGGRPLLVDRLVQSLGDTTLTLRGTVAFDAAGVAARIDSLHLAAGALRATALEPARVAFASGRLHAAPLVLDLDPGRLDLELDWNVSGGTIDLRGHLEGLDLARVARSGPDGATPSGVLSASFIASGAAADPEIGLRGSIARPRLGGVTGDSLRARLDYAPGVLTVESLEWRRGASAANLRGTLRTSSPLETMLRQAGGRDRSWAKGVVAALEADADSFDLSLLAPIDSTLRTLEGHADLHARIGGTVASPTLAVEARGTDLRYRALQGKAAVANAAYRDQVLTIERFEVRDGASLTRIAGFLPVDLTPFERERWKRDEALGLTIRMNEADFSVLPTLTSLVASSAGKLSGEAEVTGTPRRPKLKGAVQLREGRVRFAGRYEVIEQLAIDGSFDESVLTLTKIDGRQGKRGRLTGDGTWRWSDLGQQLPAGSVGPPGVYQVRLKASDCVATDREYYQFQFTGSFVVTNGRTSEGIVKPRITGSAVVSRGELALNLSGPAGEPPAPLPFLYSVTAEFPRQFKYRQLDTEIDLSGSLQLRNEGERDIALGTLTVRGGHFYFLTRKFTDLSGEVNFKHLDRLDPEVAIDAKTRVARSTGATRAGVEGAEDQEIFLAVTGRASRMTIRPWDTNGTGVGELWSILSVGQFTGSSATEELAGSDPLSGMQLRDLPIRDYLFRNAERWISGSGFLDTVDLRSGSQSRSNTNNAGGPIDLGTVGVGKYVTPDLFLKYSRDFSGQSEAAISAEYRVTRHLLLRGQQIDRARGSATSGQEYNLDLKIRVEY
jgi:hypothetical protein